MANQMYTLNITCRMIENALSSEVVEASLLRLKFKA